MQSTNAIIPGSISALAQQSNKSLAETFVSCDVIILVDTSSSMSDRDSRGGRTRYEVACEELTALQKNMPGKIAVISFSNDSEFCPSGIPRFLNGGTSMDKGLQFVKVADFPGMKFILISDGEPNDAPATLKVAKTFVNKIDTIFVGPETGFTGREFLRKLSAATGGQTMLVAQAKELNAGIQNLLNAGH